MLNDLPLYQPTNDNLVANDIYRTKIPELLFIKSQKHLDERGYFSEVTRLPELNALLDTPFKPAQINHAKNKKNVIKGFHAENWNKLVTVPNGITLSVLVDVRKDSPTFGQYQMFLIGDDPDFADALYGALYIPAGVANSVLVLSENLNYFYFFDKLYKERDPSQDVAISLFDPELNVPWPIEHEKLIISERDRQAINLSQL